MKNLIYVLAIVLAFTGCKKEEKETSKFPADVQEVLNTIVGVWECTDSYNAETFTFTAYEAPTQIPSASSSLPAITFHGNIHRHYRYVGDTWEDVDYFFYINPDKKVIYAYEVKEGNTWAMNGSLICYDYKIEDNNTIRLHDQQFNFMHEYVYTRKQ